MSEAQLTNLQNPEEQLAAARSRAYRIFAEAWEYPDGAFAEMIRAGDLAAALRETLGAIDSSLAEGIDWEGLAEAGAEDDLAVEYTRLFDVGSGGGGPPCPLYGGLYGGARMKTMEEAVRFYNFFGLKMSESPRELPDHVTTQLEFLHFLAFREAEALQQGEDADSYRRAARDFIDRNIGKWIPKLCGRIEQNQGMRFFRALGGALRHMLERDRAYLVARVGSSPSPKAN